MKNSPDLIKQQKSKAIKNINSYTNVLKIPIGVPEEKAGNTSENLINDIKQIKYSFASRKRCY